jgi:DNA-binding transcriptional MerR regulator
MLDATPLPLTVGSVLRRLLVAQVVLSEDRIRQLANIGALPSTRTANGIRLFAEADVDRFIAARKAAAEKRSAEPKIPRRSA